ncbi:MAG: hypothetical protein ACI80V_001679 [Rhodothermales bacterium]|jgi:hypothetical protein
MIQPRLLVVGRKLTDDLLIWNQLGRSLAKNQAGPTIILHSPGEMTERILEGDGFSVSDVGGSPAADRAMMAAFRQENRMAASTLTEEGVPAVAFLGTDRQMIALSEAGKLTVTTGFLGVSVEAGAIPVIGILSRGPSGLVVPACWEVLAEWSRMSSNGSIRVHFLHQGRQKEPISAEDAVNLTGERGIGSLVKLPGLSVNVIGVSGVGSGEDVSSVYNIS